ncbi:unnamed protein product [Leuciscus chuanchicus]
MELFIFIALQLFMEVQSYKSPVVKVFPDVLNESSSVKMICEPPEDVKVNQCYFYRNREENNTKASWKCELDLTSAEVLRWADVKSPASVDIYCFYTITEHGIEKPSSHSPAVTVTVLVSTTATTAHTTTTAMTTSLTVRSTSETRTYSKSVDLHSKTNLPTNTTKETIFFTANSTLPGNRNMSEHEMYSLITSVPATSQPISVGLEHPESHQDSTPDPTATDSFIMSENSIYQPSDVLVNTQQKEGNTEENENVYHLYCTIPDKPVHSNAGDQVYSLVKMH